VEPHVTVLELPGVAESPAAARRLVRAEARRRGLPDHVEDAALLLTSEVVTNAVLHARGPLQVAVPADDGGDRLRVEVSDRSAALPRRRDHGLDVTTGRGVRLIATLARAWGTERPSDVPGYAKTVWFEVDVRAPDVTAEGFADLDLGPDVDLTGPGAEPPR
jgi:anti-sigma regulatory factor (Ser/Thr protein kinase)